MLTEHPHHLPKPVLKEGLHVLSLFLERSDERSSTFGTPTVEAVHLVPGHDERRPGSSEDLQALNGLRLEPFHDVHHKDGDVGQLAST